MADAASPFPAVLDLPEEVVAIAETLEDEGYETWAVGGAIRDRLLDDHHGDVDLATAAEPEVVQRLFRRTVAVGVRFGTVGVLDAKGQLHEVTTFRRDVETDGRHATVKFGVSLEEDLARRDFTINAIAYHPTRHEWRDPFGGKEDLDHGVVRAVGDPSERFQEDYLRILRGLRFAARFGFPIDLATWDAAVAAAPGLAHLSAERVRDEWFKGLRTAKSIIGFADLWRLVGAAEIWLPELRSECRLSEPLPEAAPGPHDPVVLSAILLSDPVAALERLRCSNQEIARARGIMAGQPAPHDTSALAVRRWLRKVGSAAVDLELLTWYVHGSPPAWAEVVAGVRQRGEATDRQGLAISGRELLGLGIPAGPELGELLERLLDAVVLDPELNSREHLLELAARWH